MEPLDDANATFVTNLSPVAENAVSVSLVMEWIVLSCWRKQSVEGLMEKRDQWNSRAGGTISVIYLLIFTSFEVYSAMATALDSSSRFPRWETFLGWALLVLPALLLASLFLLHGKRPKLGFLMIIANLCLYASFLIYESVAFAKARVSHWAEWEVGGIWLMLVLLAVLAAGFLEIRAQKRGS